MSGAGGGQGYPPFICGIHAEERGSQGVWKGSSARAPYDGVLPAPVDRLGQRGQMGDGSKSPKQNATGVEDTTGEQCSTFLGCSIRTKEASASGQITENDKQVTGQM